MKKNLPQNLIISQSLSTFATFSISSAVYSNTHMIPLHKFQITQMSVKCPVLDVGVGGRSGVDDGGELR